MKKLILILGWITTLLSPSAFAQLDMADARVLNSFDTLHILLVDAVEDGCLPRPDEVKKAAELQLRRNNFKIGRKGGYRTPYLLITAGGFHLPSGGQCVVSLSVEISIWIEGVPFAESEKNQSSNREAYTHSITLVASVHANNSREETQKVIEDGVSKAADELFLKTQRAKDFIQKGASEVVE